MADSSSENAREVPKRDDLSWKEFRAVAAGGAVVALFVFLLLWGVGVATDAEAGVLIQASDTSIRYLSNGVLTVGFTVLALMLTLLGLSQSMQTSFSAVHYRRIRRISLMSSIAIVGGVLLLLVLSLPIEQSGKFGSFESLIYYGLIVTASLLGGLLVAIVLMLHRTIKGLSKAEAPTEETSSLIQDDRD